MVGTWLYGMQFITHHKDKLCMHACDAGTVSSEVPSDSEDTNNPLSSDSISSESPPRLADLAASFQVFLDLTEMEMIKVRKASRLEAEKRRMELEAELTRMMLQTQLQIASIVAGKGTIEESCEVGIDVIQSMVVASRIRTPYNVATVCEKKKRERETHTYLLRLVEVVLAVKREEKKQKTLEEATLPTEEGLTLARRIEVVAAATC
ncbi:hypothetical protein POTOM_053675 [Populus tomentosa]|uniref:Uncharacterized protein n=1 Tax=Populus tomentosa TaxID=118781 RepID=A0A8X7Y2B9_POPTO|nr:hypothetical protein POTOM_053675 [Populus tomentosa]